MNAPQTKEADLVRRVQSAAAHREAVVTARIATLKPEKQVHMGMAAEMAAHKGRPPPRVRAACWRIAVFAYTCASNSKCPAGMYRLGLCYTNGTGVVANRGTARSMFENAAKLGDAPAMVMLGKIHLSGDGVVQDAGVAMEWLCMAESSGYRPALPPLARIMYKSVSLHIAPEVNPDDCLRVAQTGIDHSNDRDCHTLMGSLYEHGVGVERSVPKAVEHYWMAAEAGALTAAMHMADYSIAGKYEDFAAARRWITFAHSNDESEEFQAYKGRARAFADGGCARSKFFLGILLELGIGVGPEACKDKDMEGALQMYNAAAAQRLPEAIMRLGDLHLVGSGVAQDIARAKELYHEAAELGCPNAAAKLAIQRLSESREDTRAYEGLKKALEEGSSVAAAFERKFGIPPNIYDEPFSTPSCTSNVS